MSKALKTLTKALDVVGDGPIVVTGSIASSQGVVLFRQFLLMAGAGLVTNGTVSDDQLQQIVGGLIALATFLYGQYKARKDKAERVVLADAAPEAVGTVQGLDPAP